MSRKISLVFFYLLNLMFFAILTLCPKHAFTEEQSPFTLQKSIDEALEKNWSLKATEEQVNQAVNIKNQARAEFMPKLSTSYGYTRLSEPQIMRPSFPGIGKLELSPEDNYQWKGTVTQPLFTGFALISSYELARLGIDQSKLNLDLNKLDLVLQVKEAYFNVLIADKAVEVAEKEVVSLTSNVSVASSFYKVGVIPVNDLLKAEVELANAKQNLVKAQNAAKMARSAFNRVLARPVNQAVELEDILFFKPEQVDFDKLIDQAFKDRPEMKIIDISILQTDQQVRLSKSRNYPEISLHYNYIKEGDHIGVSGSPFHDSGRWETMAVCSWTFWEWGKTYYSVKEKESRKDELIKTRLALEDSIRLELKDALLALDTAEKNIPTTKKAVEQGEENLRVNEERYKAQVTTITEVLDAQTLLTQARVNYNKALYEHNLARARLLRTIGTY